MQAGEGKSVEKADCVVFMCHNFRKKADGEQFVALEWKHFVNYRPAGRKIYIMNLGNFTIKAAEVVQQAQQLAFNAQSPNIETDHLLAALLEQQDSPVEYLLKKNCC
jgi:hypothetical protein